MIAADTARSAIGLRWQAIVEFGETADDHIVDGHVDGSFGAAGRIRASAADLAALAQISVVLSRRCP